MIFFAAHTAQLFDFDPQQALAPLAKVDNKGRFHYSDHFLALAKHHLEDKLNLDQDPPLGEDEAPADQSTLEPIKFVKA